MKETAEELLKFTRNELEEMAEKLGITTAGMPKTVIAKSIIESRGKAKAHKAAATVKAKSSMRIGKKGVLAKRAAIEAQMRENEEAVAKIGTGIKELQNGIDDQMRENEEALAKMEADTRDQMRENEEAVAKIGTGVEELQNGIKDQMRMNEEAVAKIGTGIKDLQDGIKDQMRVNEEAIARMEADLKMYQDETAKYIHDFYYG